MLSLDLQNATDAQREDFNSDLAERAWLKLRDVDTVWCKRFKGISDDDDGAKQVRNSIARDIKNAAAKAKIQKITYVAQLSNRDAIGRIAAKANGEYGISHYDPYPN
jgi:hypothetical protein